MSSQSARIISSSVAPLSFARGQGRFARLTRLSLSLLVSLQLTVLPGLASAQVVADPRAPQNQQSLVGQAANGVPLVNIQTPSAAGVSRNTYQQFDVNRQGVILNNAQKNVSTQLGGWVEGNANLKKGSARIILNEVNSMSPSQLRGYMEIAGSRAQLVIANPSGIVCDGCGFINANRATLTTGTPIFQDGNLTGYRVQGGRINIEGQGLDARGTDYTDLITRAVSINSGLWAEHLNVVTGTNQVSTDLSQISPIAGNGNDPKPAFALDVASLGGMYGGKIYLIGTEAGLGVINAGHIGAAVGDVTITVDGRLESKGSLNSTGNTQITARQGIQNQGTLYAQGNLNLNTSGNITNTKIIAAAGNTSLSASGNIQGTSGSLIAAGLQPDNTLAASGILTLNAGQTIDLQHSDLAGHTQRLNAAQLQLANSRIQGNSLYLTATGNADLQGSKINLSHLLNTQVSGLLDTRSARIVAGQLDLTAQTLDNTQGTLLSQSNATLNIGGHLNNTSGLIGSGTLLQIVADTLDNQNTAGADQGIEATTLNLLARQINNTQGSLRAQESLNLKTQQLDNTRGTLSSAQTLSLSDTRLGRNSASTLNLTNSGGSLLAGQNLKLNAATLLGNGKLVSQGDLTLDLSGDWTQTGLLSAQNNLNLTVGGLLNNQGTLTAGDGLSLHAAQLHNAATGSIQANFVTLQTQGTLTNRGLIDSLLTRITAQTLNNLGTGSIYGDRVSLQADTLTQDAEGGAAPVIAARDRLDIGVGTLTNRENALLFSGGNLNIGRTIEDGAVSGQADSITNASATIEALGDINISTRLLTNTDTHYGTITFPTDTIQVTDYQTDNGVVDGSQVGWLTYLKKDRDGMYYAFWDKTDIVLSSSTYGNPAYQRYLDPQGGNMLNPSFAIPLYDKNDQVWGLFGMPNPAQAAPKTERPVVDVNCFYKCAEAAAAWDEQMAPWKELQKRIDTARQEVLAETISYKSYRQYSLTHYGAQVVNAQPGQIISGGNMLLDVGQTLNNHMSHILAGGYLDLFGQNVTNESASVTVFDDRVGKVWKWEEFKDCGLFGCDSYHDWKKYNYTANEAHTVDLNLARTESHTTAGTGTQLNNLQLNTATDAPAVPQIVDDIATVRPDLKLPSNSLFKLNTDPQALYLIETDPRFANYKTWLSSDYMLRSLKLDMGLHKRLGDGFYEQRLIREQIGQLTGRRFLEGYANDEAQYQALLENGVRYAQEHQLIPGIALSAAQMAQLTSDIVWLVEQTITLADGSTTRALVPQVYLRVKEGDLAPGGAMIAGNQVYMNLEQDLTNRGLISGQELVDLNGRNLNNLGGHIQSATVWLTAEEDINNIGGRLKAANELIADAGRDIRMETTTATTETRTKRDVFKITNVDQVASVELTAPGATLELNAGRDITLTGARVHNEGDNILISAGRDLNLNTVAVADHTDITRSKRNYLRFGQDAEVGTRITLGGVQAETPGSGELGPFANTQPQLTLLAGNDIKARAASVDSAGSLDLVAKRNISIEAGTTDHYISTASYASGSSAFSSSSAESRSFRSSSRAQGSSFGGETVNIQAGQDISLLGSHVIADKNLLMSAGRDINMVAATESTRQSDYRKEKNSGFFSTGGMGFTIGKQEQMTDGKGTATYAAASTVGSIEGNITLVAGRNYTQTGSHIVTPAGDVGIAADQILIQEARETSSYEQKTKFKQSGLTLSAGSPLITAVQTAEQMSNAAGDSDNSRTKALALASTLISGYNAYQAISQLSGSNNPMHQMGGLTLSLNLGKSESESSSWQRSNTSARSSIASGGNITLMANTENRDGNITIQGSDLTANKNMLLVADRDINLLASRNTYEQGSKNKSSSSSIGVSVGASGSGFGFSVSASSNKSSGHANGNGLEWTNTHLLAGNTLTLISGNDLTLKGATARGDTLLASVGGNLTIESLQGTDDYKSQQKSSGFSLSVPITGGGMPGGSVSKGRTDIDSNYKSVVEQSALKAGDGGFDVNVGGDTTLIGGAILSTQEAIDRNNNSFHTGGELTLVDLKNKAEYEGTSYSVNLGAVPSTDGNLTPGSSSFGYGKESGEASSTTHAAISGIAGKEEARTGDKESGIEKIFDADEVERKLRAQVEAMQKFGELAPKAAAEFADKQARQLLADAGNETDEAKQTALIEEAKRWGEGGAYRVALHTALGGLAGGMEGALGAGATAQAASMLNQLQESLASSLKQAGLESSLADAAGGLIAKVAAAGLGNAVGGMPGAGMGLNVEANNRQLHDNEIAWLEKNAKKFAEEQGISEQEALVRLAQQAMKDVDFMWRAVLKDGNDDAAKEFLGKTDGTFVNDLGEKQKLFTTSGQQLFRPEMFGDTADPAFYKAYVQSGISRSLSDGLKKEFKDLGIDLKDSAVGVYELAKEHPWEFVKGIGEGIKNIPQGIKDSFKDTGHAIGEGAAVALNEELADKLQAIYGVDPSAYQEAALLIRVVGAVMGAAGTAKAGAKVTEAVGKKLDDIAEAAAKKKEGIGGGGHVPDVPKDLPKNPLLDDAIPRDGDRLVLNQGNTPTCGHNSCGMVLDTMGKPVDIVELIQRVPPASNGIYTTDVAKLLKGNGVDSIAFSGRNVDDLARYTKQGNPVIVRIVDNTNGSDFSHFVVVDGVTTRNGIKVVAIRDPHGTQYFSPASTFQANFSGDVVVTKIKSK